MIKKYSNITIMLFAAWTVYATCQKDTALPLVIGCIVLLSLLMRLRGGQGQFAFFAHIPLSTTIIGSLLAGWMWAAIIPDPQASTSPFPVLTAAVQSGTIFASLMIYLRPLTDRNMYYLTFLAWLNVAVSINVPFSEDMLLVFCFFCILATAIIILHTTKKPSDKRHYFRYYRDFVLFSALLVLLTTGFFYGISRSIVFFDHMFMNLIDDYIIPRNYTHFLRINSRLALGPPGRSAFDDRPVLEITLPEGDGAYLKTQIFEDYVDGTWIEPAEKGKLLVPAVLDPDAPQSELTMFTSFEDIIPSPVGITAAAGNAVYTKDQDDIVYTDDEQRMRTIKFSLSKNPKPVTLTPAQLDLYRRVPPAISRELRAIADSIVGEETDPLRRVYRMQDYFHEHFLYSLNVNFRADDKGILKMLTEKRPAYCSYFASALALLLRSEGYPSRVAAGFLVTEPIDHKTNRFLGRVNNAHAWTEVLLPAVDIQTGKNIYVWETLDATPFNSLEQALDTNRMRFRRFMERIWLTLLRANAYLESTDKEKLKSGFLKFFVLLLLLINRKKIFDGLIRAFTLLKPKRPTRTKPSSKLQVIYKNYEHYLNESFGETRKCADTDTDVLDRLKRRNDIPPETIAKVEVFLHQYQAVRFGNKNITNLKGMIDSMRR